MATDRPSRDAIAAAIREFIRGLDAAHYAADDVPGCVLCWPDDDSWPCAMRMVADDLRALADAEREAPDGD